MSHRAGWGLRLRPDRFARVRTPTRAMRSLRECIPAGQKRRGFPLERRFRADVVSRLNSPSRFRNSRSFKVSKPRKQYTHGCVEERIPVAPCRQRCRGAFAESYKPDSIVRNGLKPIGNRMRCERVYHHEGEYCIITGIGTNGFIVSAYPAGSTRRRKSRQAPHARAAGQAQRPHRRAERRFLRRGRPGDAARRGVAAGEQANLILATTALHIRSTGF